MLIFTWSGVEWVDSVNDAIGVMLGTIVGNVNAALVPQTSEAATLIEPIPVPTVTVIVFVVLVPLHPVPDTVHT